MSELSRKLAAMKKKAAPSAPVRTPELVERAFSRPADGDLGCVTPQALRRMGLEGGIDWEKTAFLDSETTGLSGGAGTLAFLVGVGRIHAGTFTVTQVMMRDYADEPLLLSRVEELLSGAEVIVTFNGRTFDLPLLESRRVMCRMAPMKAYVGWDLLYPSRKVWKMRIKSCRLARIEDVILMLGREDDLPGSEAPARFFEFLKTGDMRPMEAVIEDKRQDVLTMETLLCRLGKVYDAPAENPQQMDLFSLGRVLEKEEADEAKDCFKKAGVVPPGVSVEALAGVKVSRQAGMYLAKLYLREKDYPRAEETLEKLCRNGGWAENTEMAKLCEHHLKDPRRALKYAREAEKHAALPKETEDSERRVQRLTMKLEAKNHG